jgi:predicted Ser/Thr protein kinase
LPNIDSATITLEQLRRARQVFEEASALQGAARKATLDRECRDDRRLRALVQQMLTANDSDHPWLDDPLVLPIAFEDIHLPQGAMIGRYRVIREIGTGGMGNVYLADLPGAEAEERFAIKVMRWVSPELSQRFRREQAILRRLNHSNIARFVEAGGTEEDSPYFVMEYVKGRPIHTYCEQNRLSTGACIGLFRQVCAAVRYLHQNLVVHRDLKPANILVTADEQVKLVDFGIAKLLQSPGNSTSTVNATAGLMTPDYASPEQIRGGTISTLTDVYSLGVLLYELLAGAKPFSSKGVELPETLRRICEEEPPRPSAALKLLTSADAARPRKLDAELDNIVLKALQKDPARRYISVEQFDEDLRRYQTGLPVLAQGDSAGYRLKKFISRYRASVAAGLIMLALLTGGIVATTIEARRAQREATRAELHSREAERQKAAAEAQARIAEQERNRAEQETVEAQRERQNAERRLAELNTLARGATDIYRSARTTNAPAGETVARLTKNSLLALGSEHPLPPEQVQLLEQIDADVQSYQLANDQSWKVPEGWKAHETNPHQYRVGLDDKIKHGRTPSLFLRSLKDNPDGSVGVDQLFDAAPYRGKRVRVTGFYRMEKVAAHIIFELKALDEKRDEEVYERFTPSGTSPWKKFWMVIDVPAAAQTVEIHLGLRGPGTVWASDLNFRQVDSSVPLTTWRQTRPMNLDFTTPQ